MSDASEAAFRSYLGSRRKSDRARALDELLGILQPMMARVARAIVAADDVDDVVQEALASVAAPGLLQLQRGRAMREGPRSLGALVDAYAATVARQKALMHRRRAKSRPQTEELLDHREVPWLEHAFEAGEYREIGEAFELPMEQVLDTAAGLERMRVAIVVLKRTRPRWARALEIVRKGGTAADVARRLKITPVTARKVLERGRKALRILLEGDT